MVGGYQGIPGGLGTFKGIVGYIGCSGLDLEGFQGLFGRVPRIDLGVPGEFLEDLWSSR